MITITIPMFLLILLQILAFILVIRDHGKPKSGNDNFFTTLIAAVMYWGLWLWHISLISNP